MAKISLVENLILRAKGSNKVIVLPEGNDERVIKASIEATKLQIAKIVILGDPTVIVPQLGKKFADSIVVINPLKEEKMQLTFAEELYNLRREKGLTLAEAKQEVKKPMVFATMMAKLGYADGVVAGLRLKTSEVIKPAFQIIKAKPGVNKVSSFMIMEIPEGINLGNKGVLFFADCGVIIDPSSEDLASIATETALSARKLCSVTPKVALLSYSTHASGNETDSIIKIRNALKIIKSKTPELIVDGEIQADAALNAEVSKAKCGSQDILGGKANILVFPDLNSANISYKLVQRIAGISAVGPILQGLNKPVNDMSRGATYQELIKLIAVTALQAKQI